MSHDEETIRRAVECADLNVLRIALLQATGDPSLANMRLERVPMRGGSMSAARVKESHHDEIKDKSVKFLLTDAERFEEAAPSDARLRPLMELLWGEDLSDRDFAYRRHLLAFDEFPRAAAWSATPPELPPDFRVVVVGAGFSGVAIAAQLQRLGIPYVVIERRSEVGGTWSVNTYPDARVDTMSLGYQYSFEKRYPWSEYFARQDEVRRYVEHVARRQHVFENVWFDARVVAATFDEKTSRWLLDIDRSGERMQVDAKVVVSAGGLFSTAKEVDIPGVEAFSGTMIHTSEWSGEIDVAGKDVAVIGNGSTGVQLLSSIAQEARRVTAYQRTPQWIGPREKYGEPIPSEVHWLWEHMPYYWNWSIYATIAMVLEGQDLQDVDASWQRDGGIVSARNDGFRANLIAYITSQIGDRPDLLAKLTPQYPPLSRRLVADNNWYKTLLRDNVELVTEPIQKVGAGSIETADGVERPTDIVVAAVGFSVEKYLWPAEYRGRDGLLLEDAWARDKGPRAHLGMTVPGFPNLFIMYGPNSQPRSGGSMPSWMETWARYIANAITMMVERGAEAIEVRQDVFERYNQRLDAASELLVWADKLSTERNYYVNQHGRQQVNAPWRVEEYYALIADPCPEDFTFG